MVTIGIIREEKIPKDVRVALTPEQCVLVEQKFGVKIVVETSPDRCYADALYEQAGLEIVQDLSQCDIIIGIKEVPIDKLIEGKTYLFFSHTKKKQPYNQKLMQALIKKNIRMIDYEALTHADGQRILGFGFYAGVVGAHNGLLTYGKKYDAYDLKAAHECHDLEAVTELYQHIDIPPIKIVVTGSGKVASGIVDMMDRADIEYVEPEDFLTQQFNYPVYTHLKGSTLYKRKDDGSYQRDDFHKNPKDYACVFQPYLPVANILMNGIYWDKEIERLFEKEDIQKSSFRMNVIADITCDVDGSVPINMGASSIAIPVYGIDKHTLNKTQPYQNTDEVVDVMAVDNLPNELPRDASFHFGQHLKKFVLPALLAGEENDIVNRATICKDGKLTPPFEYLSDYAYPISRD
ncbi:MAG TPA: NAD(P)-dependent oxidoreductase [Flavipsychrobacter sp.]|nr:NAD(P)-dependent oxidoreductase [Flavipsychrobacter sp.]